MWLALRKTAADLPSNGMETTVNRKFTREEKETGEDARENRLTWQRPELTVLDLDQTQGGALGLDESDDGTLFS